jgi:hypothetical protein
MRHTPRRGACVAARPLSLEGTRAPCHATVPVDYSLNCRQTRLNLAERDPTVRQAVRTLGVESQQGGHILLPLRGAYVDSFAATRSFMLEKPDQKAHVPHIYVPFKWGLDLKAS